MQPALTPVQPVQGVCRAVHEVEAGDAIVPDQALTPSEREIPDPVDVHCRPNVTFGGTARPSRSRRGTGGAAAIIAGAG
jgi:hypothetical protein